MADNERSFEIVMPEIKRAGLCYGDFMKICNEMERQYGVACCTECEFLKLCRLLDCIKFTDTWHGDEEKLSDFIREGLAYYEEKVKELREFMKKYGDEPGRDVVCPSCQKITLFNDSEIPNGENYEVMCKHCGTLIKRKKIL